MLDDRTMHRYENTKSRVREVSQNHRANYRTYTNSDIFFSKESLNTQNDIKKQEKKQNTTSFVPKFTEKSALERKFNEFHNADNSTTFDTMANSSYDLMNVIHKRRSSAFDLKSDYSTYNPKERRIKELYSTMQNEEMKFFSPNENNITFDDKIPTEKLDPKKIVVSDMYSNIFNDPEKNKKKYIEQIKFEEKTKDKKDPPKNVPKSKISSNFHWLDENTELNFKENLKTEVNCTPKKRRLKNIYSSIDSDLKDVTSNLNYKTVIDDRNNSQQTMSEVKKMLKDKFGTNHKYCKAIETIGRFHDNDFYENLKIGKTDRTVETYETGPIKNYDNFDVNEIKKMFTKSGIHVYDIQIEGKYIDSNNHGKVGFKIRKNEDLKDFEKKKKEVFKKLNEMGITMQEASLKGKRPV